MCRNLRLANEQLQQSWPCVTAHQWLHINQSPKTPIGCDCVHRDFQNVDQHEKCQWLGILEGFFHVRWVRSRKKGQK